MEATQYSFGERLRYSDSPDVRQAVTGALKGFFPNATAIRRAAQADDLTGVDYWVDPPVGRPVGVDVKVRSRDFPDLALETWSVLELCVPGWTRDLKKKTDYVLYYRMDTGRSKLLPFAPLRRAFMRHWLNWSKQYTVKRQRTVRANGRSYHSEVVFVPEVVVDEAIRRLSVN